MDLKTLREKRAKLIADARAIQDRATTEARDLTAEDVGSQRKMLDDAKLIAAQIRNEEDLQEEERITFPETQRTASSDAADDRQDTELRTFLREAYEGRGPTEYVLKPSPAQLRAQARGLDRRTLNTLQGSKGGFSVAPDTSMYGQIVEAKKAFGGVELFGATVLTTGTGAELPIATEDDTTNTGAIVAEEGSHASGTDIALGQRVLRSYINSTKIIKFSMQLEEDSAFPLVAHLSKILGVRLARFENTKLTTGTGANEPEGIVTGATIGRTGATGFATTIDFAELKRAKHSLNMAYRTGAKWMFNDTTALNISLVVDGNGRFLLTDSVREGDPMFLLGHPVVINDDMADMAASAKPIIFGQGSGYYIRRVGTIKIGVLRELYAENGQIGIFAHERFDGGLVDAGAVRVWRNSAT